VRPADAGPRAVPQVPSWGWIVSESMANKFQLGRIVETPGALDAIRAAGDDPQVYLRRHRLGDWGDISTDDAAENELSVEQGFRILSAYRLSDGTKIWIITEADRSATTILLPDEY
jgi:hypothetical protein